MGRGIVRDSRVFLFDEPLSDLDAKLRVQRRAEIPDLYLRLATTTVCVTHDRIEAMTMADKIGVLQFVHTEQVGTPLDLYDLPANTLVAGFIGLPSMNLLPGEGGPDGVAGGGATFAVPGVASGQGVTLGMRPEHLVLSDAEMAAVISVVEPTGAQTHILARIGDLDVTAVTRDRPAIRPGETVHLSPKSGRIHVFDRATGARLDL